MSTIVSIAGKPLDCHGTRSSDIPTNLYNDAQGQVVTLVLRVAISAATINFLWNAYHCRGTQSGINGGYVAVLYITEDAAQKGLVADNVAKSRDLTRNIQGNLNLVKENLRHSTEVLKGMKSEVRGVVEVRDNLSETVSDLEHQVARLQEIYDGLKSGVGRLETVSSSLENRSIMPAKWTADKSGVFSFYGEGIEVQKLEDGSFEFRKVY